MCSGTRLNRLIMSISELKALALIAGMFLMPDHFNVEKTLLFVAYHISLV